MDWWCPVHSINYFDPLFRSLFFNSKCSGLTNGLKFGINLLLEYPKYPTRPSKLRSTEMLFGFFRIFDVIDSTLLGSTIYPQQTPIALSRRIPFWRTCIWMTWFLWYVYWDVVLPVENAADADQKTWKISKDHPNKEQQSYYENLQNNVPWSIKMLLEHSSGQKELNYS